MTSFGEHFRKQQDDIKKEDLTKNNSLEQLNADTSEMQHKTEEIQVKKEFKIEDIEQKDVSQMSDEVLKRLKELIDKENELREKIYNSQIKDYDDLCKKIEEKYKDKKSEIENEQYKKSGYKDIYYKYSELERIVYEFYCYEGYPKSSDVNPKKCKSILDRLDDEYILVTGEPYCDRYSESRSHNRAWIIKYEKFNACITVDDEKIEDVPAIKITAKVIKYKKYKE